jgi:hypothetical protein
MWGKVAFDHHRVLTLGADSTRQLCASSDVYLRPENLPVSVVVPVPFPYPCRAECQGKVGVRSLVLRLERTRYLQRMEKFCRTVHSTHAIAQVRVDLLDGRERHRSNHMCRSVIVPGAQKGMGPAVDKNAIVGRSRTAPGGAGVAASQKVVLRLPCPCLDPHPLGDCELQVRPVNPGNLGDDTPGSKDLH